MKIRPHYNDRNKRRSGLIGFHKERIYFLQGEIIKDHFEWFSLPKNTGSQFVGTSPELEMATYTVCFLARPNQPCPVQMNTQQFQVQTHSITDQNLVGSAFPEI